MFFDEIKGFTMEAPRFKLKTWRVCPLYSERSDPESHESDTDTPPDTVVRVKKKPASGSELIRPDLQHCENHCCGFGSGIQCFLDPGIRNRKKSGSGINIPDKFPIN
jgi:hypothetical protein